MASRNIKPHKDYTRWTDKDKLRVVLVYKSLGSLRKTAEVSGVPFDTLTNWKNTDWFKEALLAAKQEDTVELEDAATQVSKLAVDALQDRLKHGDTVLNKLGEPIRKPVSAHDAAVIFGISLQKRKELQEEPVRVAELGTRERLLKLVQQFANLAGAKTIEGELVDEGASGEIRERIEPTDVEIIDTTNNGSN